MACWTATRTNRWPSSPRPAEQAVAAREDVLDLRTDVGVNQEIVETAKAERTAERDTLDLARSKMVGVDPLEAASTYQALEVQLRALYEITPRGSPTCALPTT